MPGPSGLQGQDTALPQISAAQRPAATQHGQAAVAPKHQPLQRQAREQVRRRSSGGQSTAGRVRGSLAEVGAEGRAPRQPPVLGACCSGSRRALAPPPEKKSPWLEIPRTLSAEESPKPQPQGMRDLRSWQEPETPPLGPGPSRACSALSECSLAPGIPWGQSAG